jgi:two-component system, sensor histidine kinase and response regulator
MQAVEKAAGNGTVAESETKQHILLDRRRLRAFLARMTIRQKLYLIVMAPVLSALILASVLLFAIDVYLLRQMLKGQIGQSASFVADHVAGPLRHNQPGKANDALFMLKQDERIESACLYDAEGRIFARYYRGRQAAEFPEQPPGGNPVYFRGTALYAVHQIQTIGNTIGTLYIKADVSFLRMRTLSYTFAVILIILISAIAAALMSQRLQGIIAGPVMNLALTARLVSKEKDYAIRARRQSRDEIGELVDEFNEMLSQIEVRDRALQEAHDHLEDRVDQRTRELRREIGERERVEKELQRAMQATEMASRSKSEFLANMSHEIRTPMNGVIGMTELLLKTRLSPQQQKYAGAIRRSGSDLLNIINDILDFSKVEAGEIHIDHAPFDLKRAAEDVVELLSPKAEEKGLMLMLRYQPGVPRWLTGDAGRIRQIITNLTANAIKFTHEGHVLINVECPRQSGGQAEIRVIVEDTGIGTPRDKLDRIFGKYTQAESDISREYGGTGLGLAICRQLIEFMEGEINVKSREGVGSRFYFTLQFPVAEIPEGEEETAVSFHGERILVAGHNPVWCRVVSELLEARGLEARIAGTHSRARELLQEYSTRNVPVQMALLRDAPPLIRADAFAEMIRNDGNIMDCALIVITDSRSDLDLETLSRAGFSAQLSTPWRQEELMQLLAMVRDMAATDAGGPAAIFTRQHLPDRAAGRHREEVPDLRLGLHVLVAEDNFVNQQVIYETLDNFGCETAIVADGGQAVRMVRSQDFDVVFMDCEMPVMDGFTASIEIRRNEEEGRHVPIIALTAHAIKGDRERCLAAGMDNYVSKPVTPAQILRVLRETLRPECFPDPDKAVRGVSSPREEAPSAGGGGDAPVEADMDPGARQVLDLGLAREMTGNRQAMYQRVTDIFLKHGPIRLQEMKTALMKEDYDEIMRLAHSLKGASGAIGGVRIQYLAIHLEDTARNGSRDQTEQLVSRIQAELDRLVAVLKGIDWESDIFAAGGERRAAQSDGPGEEYRK